MEKHFFEWKHKDFALNGTLYAFFLIIAFLGILYGQEINNHYNFIRVWQFENLLWMCLGIPFLFLMKKASIPDFWQQDISIKSKLLFPLGIGFVFGILDVLVWKVMLHPAPYEELPPFLQPFPYSIFLYFSGAFEVEVFYRLIPLSIFLLLGSWFKKGQFQDYFFYIGVVLTSLREPLEQLTNEALSVILYSFISGFLMNAIQALYFKKAGFLASLFIRLGHYLLWHILLGIYVEIFEI